MHYKFSNLFSPVALSVVFLSCSFANYVQAQTMPGSVASSKAVADWSARDKKFVLDVAENNLTEIKLGEIARERATSASIKAFGEKMAAGHCHAGTAMRTLAASHSLIIPSQLDSPHQALVDALAKAPENQFDQLYLREVIDAHKKAIATLHAEQDTADGDLKNWTTDTLPAFQNNLKSVQEMQAKLPKGQ
jgi:putative membrane protein